MKTTIGVLSNVADSVFYVDRLGNIASEFFGIVDKTQKDLEEGIIWITFRSGGNAKEFAAIINLKCVDKSQKSFK